MTNSEVTVDRAVVRYELDAASRGQQPRFDRILSEEVGSGLEGALDEVTRRFGRDAIVCVRRLEIALRLDSSASDRVLADAWTGAVAAAVMELFVRGGEDVIVYRSLAQPLTEIARAALGGRNERAWAWNQLGLWMPTDGTGVVGYTRALGRAACALPSSAPRVLADAVRRDRTMLARLVDAAPAIATAVLRHAGLSATAAKHLLQGTHDGEIGSVPIRKTWTQFEPAAIQEALASYPMPPTAVRAWAVIGLADSEPPWLQADTAAIAVDDWLNAVSLRGAPFTDDQAELTAAVAGNPDDDVSVGSSDHHWPTMTEEVEPPAPERELPDETGDAASPTYPATEWGGLLFLLNLVDGAVLAMFELVPFRAALVTTASLLTGAPDEDPGVQAFAGCLGTVDQSDATPVAGLNRLDEAAMATARGAAQLLLSRLAELGFPDSETVLRRQATLCAEPGWFEAQFSIDGVDLDVRRAGLDIDPGWLPWLGTVVKFRYG
jgi:hypothetical protein